MTDKSRSSPRKPPLSGDARYALVLAGGFVALYALYAICAVLLADQVGGKLWQWVVALAICAWGIGIVLGRGYFARWRERTIPVERRPAHARFTYEQALAPPLGPHDTQIPVTPMTEALVTRRIGLAGGAVLGIGLLWTALLAFGPSLGAYLVPKPDPRARVSFLEATAQPSPPGCGIDAALMATLQSERERRRKEVRWVRFYAEHEMHPPNRAWPTCAPQRPQSAVQQWSGRLIWEERTRGGTIWMSTSCSGAATRTESGSWAIQMTRYCGDQR